MTQDIDTILRGLHCCSRTNPDCDQCPFVTTEVHCRELELDAAMLISELHNKVEAYRTLLASAEEEIYMLTERLGKMNE